MKGGLNLRDNSLFNKLDTSSKTDVLKLVEMQKKLNDKSITKIVNDSLNVIYENLGKLETYNFKESKESGENSSAYKMSCILNKLKNNQNANNFMTYTTNLCKIFYKLYKEEIILLESDIEKNIVGCVERKVNKILKNLKYFKIYAIQYQPGKFISIINEAEKKLLSKDEHNNLKSLYNKFENFEYIFELDVYYSIIYEKSLLNDIEKSCVASDGEAEVTTSTAKILVNRIKALDKIYSASDGEAEVTTSTAKILVNRIKALDKIYSEIRNIITDPTFKTLHKLYTDASGKQHADSSGEQPVDFYTKLYTDASGKKPVDFYTKLELKPSSFTINLDKLKHIICQNNTTSEEIKFSENIIQILKDIFELEDDSNLNTDIDFIKAYKAKIEGSIKGGGFDIEKPVTSLEETVIPLITKHPTKILNFDYIFPQTGGGLEQQQQQFIDNLKNKIENVNPDDEQVESISDNAQRYANKLFSDVKNAIDKKAPIDNPTKILDDKHENVLKDFDPNNISNMDYTKLRKTLYKIKNSEYFDNIQIENEDIYMFILATYVLRVIALYVTTWFIEIEILKDVESVILSYIMVYVLLFLLLYTFVNLNDNKLNSTKSYLYYFYSRVNFDYTRFIIHLGILLLLIVIPVVIRVTDKERSSFKQTSDQKKYYLNTLISNMSAIIWVILSIIAFLFK